MVEVEDLNKQYGNDGDGEIQWQSKGRRPRCVSFGSELSEGLRASQPPCVWAWAAHFCFPRKILWVLCGYF